jgi:hypothetical protein
VNWSDLDNIDLMVRAEWFDELDARRLGISLDANTDKGLADNQYKLALRSIRNESTDLSLVQGVLPSRRAGD